MSTNESNNRAAPCPVTYALGVFGDRWTLRLLRDLLFGARYRYKALLEANAGLATNVLAERLKRLERFGLISKTRDPEDARQFLYRPTEAALDVAPIIVEMIVWSARRGEGGVEAAFLAAYEADREGVLAELRREVRRAAELPGGA